MYNCHKIRSKLDKKTTKKLEIKETTSKFLDERLYVKSLIRLSHGRLKQSGLKVLKEVIKYNKERETIAYS